MAYQLDSVLARDTFEVAELGLCEVRLMDNKLFPWLILVPMRGGVSEWIDLSREDQHRLADEIAIASHLLQAVAAPEKLNIAAIGNKVKQLHIHIIGRYAADKGWPEPVWGGAREYYDENQKRQFLGELQQAFSAVGA